MSHHRHKGGVTTLITDLMILGTLLLFCFGGACGS